MYTFQASSVEITWLTILLAWSLVWKGLALWKAGRRNDKIWFIVLLVINTAGILDILYIFVFTKREDHSKIVD